MLREARRFVWLMLLLTAPMGIGCAEGEAGPPRSGDAGLPMQAMDADPMVDAQPIVDAARMSDAAGPCDGVDCSAMTDMCNVGVCDLETGACVQRAVMDGVGCDDSDACTADDVCAMGACAGATLDCSAMSDMCNIGACNPATGACEPTPMAEGTRCDDGDLCTVPDVCSMGTCVGLAVDCSRLGTGCNAGACNAMTGACELVPVTDGTVCDDEDRCTTPDVCTMGACGGREVDCSTHSGMCQVGTCSPLTGGCEAVDVADGTGCDDGDPATAGDACTMGVCRGSAATSVTFPTSAARVCSASGSCATLGSGGGGRYFRRGDYLEETIRLAGTGTLSRLSLAFEMSDYTTGCAVGATHSFNVMVAGRSVGFYSFVTAASPALRRTISERYAFAGTPASGAGAARDEYTIRITAASTVCSGGSSWNWFPGGTASP